jgi:hypothetical protein
VLLLKGDRVGSKVEVHDAVGKDHVNVTRLRMSLWISMENEAEEVALNCVLDIKPLLVVLGVDGPILPLEADTLSSLESRTGAKVSGTKTIEAYTEEITIIGVLQI